MHGTLKSIEGPPNLGINLPLSIKPASQSSANHSREDAKSMNGKEKSEKKSPSPAKKSAESKKMASLGWTCWECDRLFTQRDVYLCHMRKEHGKVSERDIHALAPGGSACAGDPLRLSHVALSVVRTMSVCLTCFIHRTDIHKPSHPTAFPCTLNSRRNCPACLSIAQDAADEAKAGILAFSLALCPAGKRGHGEAVVVGSTVGGLRPLPFLRL